MPLILAIEPDRHQATQIAAIAQGRIGAELVLADSADRALRALGNRVPDLILTPQLLSPRDDEAITDRLRALGTAATFVQTLTIPALATAQPGTASRGRGLLSALRRQKAPAPAPNGCAPDVFAEQITVYLERALEARKAHGEAGLPSALDVASASLDVASGPVDVASGSVDVTSGSLDVASGFSRKEDVADVTSGSIWKQSLPQLDPEWSASPAVDAPAPAVDLWERWQPTIGQAPIDEPVPQPEVESPVLFEPDHSPATEMDFAPAVEIASSLSEPAVEPEWPAQSNVAPAEEYVPIELAAAVEPIAPVAIVAPVEAAPQTTEPARHEEEPLASELEPIADGHAGLVARFMARLRPAPTPNASVVDVPELVEPADTSSGDRALTTESIGSIEGIDRPGARTPEPEARQAPHQFTAPWIESDLTELVESIAEPAVDPEPIVTPALPELVIETPQPPEAPAPAASRPKAAKPANRKRRARPAPKDDWHFFDPEETRLAARRAKLAEFTGTDAARHS
jgi:hypothetical protein